MRCCHSINHSFTHNASAAYRTLQSQYLSGYIPNAIGQLKHLSYLCVRFSIVHARVVHDIPTIMPCHAMTWHAVFWSVLVPHVQWFVLLKL